MPNSFSSTGNILFKLNMSPALYDSSLSEGWAVLNLITDDIFHMGIISLLGTSWALSITPCVPILHGPQTITSVTEIAKNWFLVRILDWRNIIVVNRCPPYIRDYIVALNAFRRCSYNFPQQSFHVYILEKETLGTHTHNVIMKLYEVTML